jgi:predicted membrane channel-forming protein YqfA (hemolysin III family)
VVKKTIWFIMTTRTDRIHSRLTPIEPATERLPYWTRSTNPIVRRHLGLYWRTLPPELRPILYIVLGWAIMLGMGTLFPSTLFFALILMIVSIIVIPVAVVAYGYILLHVSITASDAMQEEKRNNTLHLLMATPMSLEQILLGKVAVALWRKMEDWTLINYVAALATPPLYFATYHTIWQVREMPVALPIAVFAGLVVSLLRLVLEPLMVGVMGVFLGAVVPYRNTAISLSVAFTAFYVAFLWLLGQLPSVRGGQLQDGTRILANYPLVILIDFVLPIALPALIIVVLLKLTATVITRD